MKERQNTLQYKRQDTIDSLSVEVASLGIFDALNASDIRKLATQVVENEPIGAGYNGLKCQVIQRAIDINQRRKQGESSIKDKKGVINIDSS